VAITTVANELLDGQLTNMKCQGTEMTDSGFGQLCIDISACLHS